MTDKHTRGFTIIELLIVIIVIGVLATVTLVTFNGLRARSYDTQSASEFNAIQKALENFYTINGRYPDPAQMNGTAGPTTLGLDLKTMSVYYNDGMGFATCNSNTSSGRYCYVPGNSVGIQCSNGEICQQYSMNYMTAHEPQLITLRNKQGRL